MSKKILLVDDAAFMRKMIMDTLSKNGYTDLYEAVAEVLVFIFKLGGNKQIMKE